LNLRDLRDLFRFERFLANPIKLKMVKHQFRTADLSAAYAFIDTIPARGGKPVPADEEAIDALMEEKYLCGDIRTNKR
jgi:hypothetical protein